MHCSCNDQHVMSMRLSISVKPPESFEVIPTFNLYPNHSKYSRLVGFKVDCGFCQMTLHQGFYADS